MFQRRNPRRIVLRRGALAELSASASPALGPHRRVALRLRTGVGWVPPPFSLRFESWFEAEVQAVGGLEAIAERNRAIRRWYMPVRGLGSRGDGGDLVTDLSERETDVLRLIALGHTNAEIAEKLFISVRTVETHRAHIQQKLGVSSRAELVQCALARGLVET
jgi:DNA-binding CsgD family transcriptional regulator